MKQRIRIWDLPIRLFHWGLAAAVLAAIITAEIGGDWMEWHGRLGLVIAGLLAFRIFWGFFGSTYARFSGFFPTPGKIRAYLRGEWRGEGHNPLGALSVFALLGVLTVQVLTGLFSNDDIAFYGPLFALVQERTSNFLSGIHHELGEFLLILIGLHIAAIAFYGHVKKQKLVKPMIIGWKDDAEGESATGGGVVPLILALLIAAAAIYGASGIWLPAPEVVAPAATPAW